MTETVTTKRNGYSLEHDLQPIIDGKVYRHMEPD